MTFLMDRVHNKKGNRMVEPISSNSGAYDNMLTTASKRESKPNRNVLVTGGAGFIGSHLVQALLERGDSVTVIDDLSTGKYENIAHLSSHRRFRFVKGDVADGAALDKLERGVDVIFHLAAAVGVELILRDPVHTIRTNVMGTVAVLRAALQNQAKVLLASTSEVYGKGTRPEFSEDDDTLLGPTRKSRWSYAASKMSEEFLGFAYHQQYKLPVVMFRLFNTIGPRQTGEYGMVVPRFVEQALQGKPLRVYGDGGQSRCFCDVGDAIRAIVGLGESPKAVGQVFNIGSTREITIHDLAKKVLSLVGGDEEAIQFIPYEKAYQAGYEDMRRRFPDISRIKRLLGWEPKVSLEETLLRVIEEKKTLFTRAAVRRSG